MTLGNRATAAPANPWLSVLETSSVVFRLPGYSRNLRKRVVKAPKLHFYDTGLAWWLLGLRHPEQLRAHPLRGALIETWGVSEIWNQRAHRGEGPGLFYYRDRHGAEADLVASSGESLTPVEVKAGATLAGDMLDVVRKIGAALAAVTPATTCLVSGGDVPQKRSDGAILLWAVIQDRTR